MNVDQEKRLVAEAAAELVEDGMLVGLGTGSTVAYLLPALARRDLDLRCVATSSRTEQAARELGMRVESFHGADALPRLDIAIDGADQVASDGWLVKGGGAAHTREKAVGAAADRFVVIVSSDKLVDRLSPPVPLELLEYGLAATLRRLGPVELRDVPRSPDGGIIADYRGDFDDPEELAARLAATVGVVEHGLFAAVMVSDVLIGRGDQVEISPSKRRQQVRDRRARPEPDQHSVLHELGCRLGDEPLLLVDVHCSRTLSSVEGSVTVSWTVETATAVDLSVDGEIESTRRAEAIRRSRGAGRRRESGRLDHTAKRLGVGRDGVAGRAFRLATVVRARSREAETRMSL